MLAAPRGAREACRWWRLSVRHRRSAGRPGWLWSLRLHALRDPLRRVPPASARSSAANPAGAVPRPHRLLAQTEGQRRKRRDSRDTRSPQRGAGQSSAGYPGAHLEPRHRHAQWDIRWTLNQRWISPSSSRRRAARSSRLRRPWRNRRWRMQPGCAAASYASTHCTTVLLVSAIALAWMLPPEPLTTPAGRQDGPAAPAVLGMLALKPAQPRGALLHHGVAGGAARSRRIVATAIAKSRSGSAGLICLISAHAAYRPAQLPNGRCRRAGARCRRWSAPRSSAHLLDVAEDAGSKRRSSHSHSVPGAGFIPSRSRQLWRRPRRRTRAARLAAGRERDRPFEDGRSCVSVRACPPRCLRVGEALAQQPWPRRGRSRQPAQRLLQLGHRSASLSARGCSTKARNAPRPGCSCPGALRWSRCAWFGATRRLEARRGRAASTGCPTGRPRARLGLLEHVNEAFLRGCQAPGVPGRRSGAPRTRSSGRLAVELLSVLNAPADPAGSGMPIVGGDRGCAIHLPRNLGLTSASHLGRQRAIDHRHRVPGSGDLVAQSHRRSG